MAEAKQKEAKMIAVTRAPFTIEGAVRSANGFVHFSTGKVGNGGRLEVPESEAALALEQGLVKLADEVPAEGTAD